MANKQISELPPASSLTGQEILPVYQGGARRTTIADLAQVAPEGPEGPAGAPGADGQPGTAGLGVLTGTGPPSSGLGRDGELYLDVATTRLYGPKSTTWGAGVSLIGAPGTNGQNGTNGSNGVDGRSVRSGNGAPSGAVGSDGDFYIDVIAKALYGPKTSGAWGSATTLVGPAGQNGSNGVDGTDGSDGVDGIDGQDGSDGEGVPVGGTTGQVLAKNSGADYDTEWVDPDTGPTGPPGQDGQDGQDGADGAVGATGAPGAPGADGDDGRTILSGTGAPSGNGVDGDYYFDTAATRLYGPRTGGNWGSGVSLIGPAGQDGDDGAAGAPGTAGSNGAPGADGKTVRNGTAAPSGGLGNDGDFYINTATHELYGPRTSGSWGSATSLVGPQGVAGAAGAPGAAGSNGADGKTIRNGTGVPSSGLGVDGDFYLDTAVSRLYGPKTSGAWGSGVSLVGPTGSAGAPGTAGSNGTDGKTVRSGGGAPSGGLGNDGDFYIDTVAHQLYGPKTSGSWGSATNLVGPTGSAGSNGTNGTNGSNGAPGSKLIRGSVAPTAADGVDGDYYLWVENVNGIDYPRLYGPKMPSPSFWNAHLGIPLRGDDGDAGADGTNGNSVLHGSGAPSNQNTGVDGDFYIDTASNTLYGPKNAFWGTGVSIVGPTGPAGTLSPPYVGTGAASDVIFGTKVTGDTNNRWEARADGSFRNGSGFATPILQQFLSAASSAWTFAPVSVGASRQILNTYDDTTNGYIQINRANGSLSASTPVVSGNELGMFRFGGCSVAGSGMVSYSGMRAVATENWTNTRQGTALEFNTRVGNGTSLGAPLRLVDRMASFNVSGSHPSTAASSKERIRVNTPTTLDTLAAVQIAPDVVGTKPFVIQALASQTANLLEFQDSTGAVLAAVTPAGALYPNKRPLVTKTGAYTATDSDYAIWVDSTSGAVTISLPTAAGRTGQAFEIKDWRGTSGTSNIIVDPAGSETIDGVLTKTLSAPYASLTVRSDGTNWGIV